MKRLTTLPAFLMVGFAVSAASAQAQSMSQLVLAAGLSPAEASDLSLTEIYAHKINRESGRDNKVTVSSRSVSTFRASDHQQLVASAGLTPAEASDLSLAAVAAHKSNRTATRDERIPVPQAVGSGFDPAMHPQLLANAGLTAEEASGMSLSEIYRVKQNGETGRDGWQRASK